MRRAAMLLGLSALALCSGCVTSTQPLWSPDVDVSEPKIEGVWLDADRRLLAERVCEISRRELGGYTINVGTRIGNDLKTEAIVAKLARIGDSLYADLDLMAGAPGKAPAGLSQHMIVRFRLEGDRLTIEPCDRAKMKALLKKEKAGITAEDHNLQFELTSGTPALQKFFREHGREVMGDPLIMRRKPGGPKPAAGPAASKRPDRLEEVLWWLPPDTQTLMVAQGPWKIEVPEPGQDDAGRRGQVVGLEETLRVMISGFSRDHREGESGVPPVAFALEGSRHFRSPRDLGMMPYEGAQIIVFQRPLGPAAEAIKRLFADRVESWVLGDESVLKKEKIGGHEVLWYEHKENGDVVRTYLTLPRPDVLVCATDRGYLTELLDRMARKGATRALPGDLPEWKHLDASKPIWGIRHYDRKDAASDPSSPLAGGERPANVPDDQAVGFVFTLDAGKSDVANMKYLSANKNALEIASSVWHDGVEDVRADVRTLAPGVVDISLPLKEPMGRDSATSMFLLLLLQSLGHGVYL